MNDFDRLDVTAELDANFMLSAMARTDAELRKIASTYDRLTRAYVNGAASRLASEGSRHAVRVLAAMNDTARPG